MLLLRGLIAGLIVFGGFAIAGWAIAPDAWIATPPAGKSDRLVASDHDAAPAPANTPRSVPTATFRPNETQYNTALLDPNITIFNAPRDLPSVPVVAPALPPVRHDLRKAFRCPRGTPAAAGPPTTSQIARIESSLRLSPDQEKLWRPVERALMEIARHFEDPKADAKRGRAMLSVERMQQIYWMAGPLVMSLRDAQKREARSLACAMGLGAVAALI